MASQHFNKYKLEALKGSIALATDTIKIALLKSTYTPNIDTDTFFSDIVANESSGTNYTAGGLTMSTKTETQDNTNDRAIFDADDAIWSNVTFTDARWAVIYKYTGNNATSPLIGVIDLGSTQSASADTFTINWSALGIFFLG